MTLRNALCLLIVLVLATPALAQDDEAVETRPKQDLRELMTADEFREAGLDKLSPAELENLNTWLYGFVEVERERAVEEAIPQGEEAFGLEQVTSAVAKIFRNQPEVIESRIVGKFRGWRGETEVTLENGQKWVQRGDKYVYHVIENPTVRIEKGMFGYRMFVEGISQSAGVKRIE